MDSNVEYKLVYMFKACGDSVELVGDYFVDNY